MDAVQGDVGAGAPTSWFFCNDTSPTAIYALPLHDALPIGLVLVPADPLRAEAAWEASLRRLEALGAAVQPARPGGAFFRTEEHTAEFPARQYSVCRLLLEKKIPCSTQGCSQSRNNASTPCT